VSGVRVVLCARHEERGSPITGTHFAGKKNAPDEQAHFQFHLNRQAGPSEA
jgi:hypothetical protein